MSTPHLRALSQRAGDGLARTFHPAHGRTAAYRRIGSATRPHGWRQYSNLSLSSRSRQDGPSFPAFAVASHFRPPTIPTSLASVRHVSFKELREERARQSKGPAAQPAPGAEPGAEPQAGKEEASASSAAEEAFAKAKAENEAQSAEAEAEAKRKQKAAEDGDEGEQKEKAERQEEAAPPPHGSKTPWQVFTETLNAEFKASKEWTEGTQQLSGSIHDFTQNPNVQRARSAYTRAAETASSTTGKVLLGTAGAIGKSAAWTWDTLPARAVRKTAGAVGAGVEKVTRPVRQTEAYKSVKETIDDGASQRYGGWTEKEERRKRREAAEARARQKSPALPREQEVFEEDPNAGVNVTVHKDAAWKESWRNFRDSSPAMQRLFGLKSVYQESENPLISTARSVSDRIAGFFAENETAMVIKEFREMDPSFQLEPFLNDMRTYFLPEVLEAYVKGDVETLKLWLSAAQFQVYSALMQQYTAAGLQSDGRILDIRNVDILSARILDPGDIPVFVLMCRTQEVHVYRHAKTGALAAGMEDKVQQVTYAIGVTRVPEDVGNAETRGWKFIELQKSGRDYI